MTIHRSGDDETDGRAEVAAGGLAGLGLDRDPFPAEPDPAFFYMTSPGRHALTFVQLATAQLSPVTLLLGEPGVGKSTLTRHLTQVLEPELRVGFLQAADPGGPHPFARLLRAFGRDPGGDDPHPARERLLSLLAEDHDAGRPSLLVVDDAHRLPEEDLSTLQTLIDASPGAVSPLILLLVGPPSLRERLDDPGLDALARRIEASTMLARMSRRETTGYVRHRLTVAGGPPRLFDDGALDAVHDRSLGLPRATDALCAECLAIAAREGRGAIDAAAVHAVDDAGSAAPHRRLGPDEAELPMAGGGAASSASAKGGDEARPGPSVSEHQVLSVPDPASALHHDPNGVGTDDPAEASRESGRAASSEDDGAPPAISPLDERTRPSSASTGSPRADETRGPLRLRAHDRVDDQQGPAAPAPPLILTNRLVEAPPGPRVARADGPGRFRRTRAVLDGALNGAVAAGLGALLLLPASDAAPPAPAPAAPSLATADDLYREALRLGPVDPQASAIAFARAAIRGHDRSAYYLAQMYEAGDGVPLARSLARSWYTVAAQRIEPARERLATLAPRDGADAPAEPVPLYSGRMADGAVELVWTASAGDDGFVVELASDPEAGADRALGVAGSAVRLPRDDGAAFWRIAARDAPATATSWLPIDKGLWPEGVSTRP